MKKLLIFLLSFWGLGATAQTTLNFTQVPASPDFFYTPERGANEWSYNQNIVNIPVAGTNTVRTDKYWRFTWLDFQAAGAAQGTYNFSVFDQKIQQAINAGQTFSFGIMQQCTSCDANLTNPINGNTNLLPNWLVNATTAFSWVSGGDLYPGINSPVYQQAVKDLSNAVNNHIMTTSFMGHRYQDVIWEIDVRAYGNFGEWTNNDFSGGSSKIPTVAALDSLISYQIHAFNNFQNVVMIGTYDGGQLPNVNVPAAVGYYAYTTSNAYGKLGWRRDNWGQTDGYIRQFLDQNPTVFNGLRFDTSSTARFKYAPICGEPQDGGSAGTFGDLTTEILRYGGTSFGNGNFNIKSNETNTTVANNFRAASLAAGYRFILTTGSMTTSPISGGSINISLNWQNIGVAPTYRPWIVEYLLKSSTGTVVWTGVSGRNLRTTLPGAATTTNENFTLPAIANGTYNMYVIVIDPTGYLKPLPLAITGVQTDGSYPIRTGIVFTTGTTVTANAGNNQTLQAPTSSTTLNGSGSSGPITSYAWTKISGPGTPVIATPTAVTTSVTGLAVGTYIFQLSVNGGVSTSNVTITVNPATPVVANAGPNQTIQSPASSVTLSASASTGPITSYAWTKISGPVGNIITSPTNVTTTVTNLTTGTYVFQVSLNGGVSTSQVTILVNPATVTANAGADQNITLPATLTLNGSASVGNASQNWTRISGPNTPTITNPGNITTTVTGIIAGTYVFQIQLNGSGPTDQVTIVVNPQPVQANAGPNQTITLPTSSVTLNGSSSTGPITTYAWTRISGPNTPSITTPSTVSTTVTGLIQGTYIFQLTVNGTSSDQVSIIVNPAPPLVANAGVDQTITLPSSSVTLNGSGSSGTITAIAWTNVSGPTTPTISNATSLTAAVTGLVQGTYVFRISLNSGAATDQVSVIVNPVVVVTSIFNNGAVTSPLRNDGQPLELGVKFRSTIQGYVTGIRFFKKANVNGEIHVGQLYSNTGTLLASGNFVNETTTGWQTMTFTTPVLINANTTYVAAYFSPSGNYTSTNNGLSTAVVNGNLTALADGTDGRNGVYRYSNTPAYPTSFFQASNYWVDINFSTNSAPTARITGPTQVFAPATNVNLSGITSGDVDGSIASYLWTQISGPNTASILTAQSNATNITGLVAGTYVFQLKVTDNLGAIGTTTQTVTVFRAPSHFTIGSGSGAISVAGMGSFIPGDTLYIAAGNYTSLTLTNLNHLLILPAVGTRSTFTTVSQWCNLLAVDASGMSFVSAGNPTAIDATCGTWDSVRLHNIYAQGWTGPFINASGGLAYTYGNNATYKWLYVNIDSVLLVQSAAFIQGAATPTGVAKLDVFRELSVSRIIDQATVATSNEGIGITGICFHCSARDIQVTSVTFRAASGNVGWINGTGAWHIWNFYKWGGPGYVAKIFPLQEYQDPWDNWITEVGKFNSTQYGLVNYTFNAVDTATGQFKGTNGQVWNCTLGNAQEQLGGNSSLASLGTQAPGTSYKVKNNFGFNIGYNVNNSGKPYIANNNGGWNTIFSDTSNNYYTLTATTGILDSTTVAFTNSQGSFVYYSFKPISTIPVFRTGITNPLVSVDILGQGFRVPPDLGYIQFYGSVPPPGCNCLIRSQIVPNFITP